MTIQINPSISGTTSSNDFVLGQRGAPASVTGTTVETLLCPALLIPAGTMQANSIMRIESAWSSSATTNNRIHTIKIGTTTLWTRTRNSAVSISEVPLLLLQNRGSISSQVLLTSSNVGYGSNLTTVPSTSTIDFSLEQNLYFYGQLGVAGDTLTLEGYSVKIETA